MTINFFSLDFRGSRIGKKVPEIIITEGCVCPLPAELIPRHILHCNHTITIVLPKKAIYKNKHRTTEHNFYHNLKSLASTMNLVCEKY